MSNESCPDCAVDERRAEEQRRRADRAHDQVLEAGLERSDQVDVDRSQDIEPDREPFEAEEERHQVRRLHEERHACAGGREEREVLGDVLVAHPLPVGDQHGNGTGTGDQHLGERRPTVAVERVVDDGRRDRASHVHEHGEHECGHEPREAGECRDGAPRPGGDEHGDHQQQRHRDEQRQ